MALAVEDGSPFAEALAEQRRGWESRPFVRALYHEWFARMEARLADVEGPTIELGAGIGAFKEFRPATVATDALATRWADEVVDAERLPYPDASVANLVMIDVLHHLPHPARSLAEAERVLRPGGRLVALEPYCSPLSGVAYRAFHHESVDMKVDPFRVEAQSGGYPLDANGALPTLIFWRRLDRLRERHPALEVVDRERLALLAYPLSGGLTKRRLLPLRLLRLTRRLEHVLAPLAPLMAFRCLVTLERRR